MATPELPPASLAAGGPGADAEFPYPPRTLPPGRVIPPPMRPPEPTVLPREAAHSVLTPQPAEGAGPAALPGGAHSADDLPWTDALLGGVPSDWAAGRLAPAALVQATAEPVSMLIAYGLRRPEVRSARVLHREFCALMVDEFALEVMRQPFVLEGDPGFASALTRGARQVRVWGAALEGPPGAETLVLSAAPPPPRMAAVSGRPVRDPAAGGRLLPATLVDLFGALRQGGVGAVSPALEEVTFSPRDPDQLARHMLVIGRAARAPARMTARACALVMAALHYRDGQSYRTFSVDFSASLGALSPEPGAPAADEAWAVPFPAPSDDLRRLGRSLAGTLLRLSDDEAVTTRQRHVAELVGAVMHGSATLEPVDLDDFVLQATQGYATWGRRLDADWPARLGEVRAELRAILSGLAPGHTQVASAAFWGVDLATLGEVLALWPHRRARAQLRALRTGPLALVSLGRLGAVVRLMEP